VSQPYQQPQQPNPYGQQQPQGGYGYPQQQGGYQQPQTPYGGAPVQTEASNPGLAIVLAIVGALVGAGIYAVVEQALFDVNSHKITQIGYLAALVGILAGAAIGKWGGKNKGLWAFGAVIALVLVFFGDLYGYALCIHKYAEHMVGAQGANVPADLIPSANDLFFKQFSKLFQAWKDDNNALGYILLVLAPLAAYGTAHRVSNAKR
jgi:hypothetical protein